jgi:hypothetical protein
MRHLLALAALLPGLALGAVNTVQITGSVLDPGAAGVSSGAITCTLSQPGSALDGAVSQRVASSVTITLGASGALPALALLVPNDIITPAGTAYTCIYSVRLASGRPATWSETWQLASTPDPVDIGAVPRLSMAPPVAGSYVGTAPSYTATIGSGSPAFVANQGALFCGNGSPCTASFNYTGSAWSFTPALTAGAPTGASYLTLSLHSTLSDERVLQGTASQIDLADTGANGTLTLSLPASPSVSGAWTSTAGSGANAFAAATNGARFDFGSGATDYASSDGTTVTFAAPITSAGAVSSSVAALGIGFSCTACKYGMGSRALWNDGSQVTVTDGFYAPTKLLSGGPVAWLSSPTLPTCASTIEGYEYRQAGGTSGGRTKKCLCTSDGAGTPAYAWKNVTTVFASEAASVGTSTTCP